MQAYVYVGLTVVRRPSQKIRPKKNSPKKIPPKIQIPTKHPSKKFPSKNSTPKKFSPKKVSPNLFLDFFPVENRLSGDQGAPQKNTQKKRLG